MNLCCNCTWNTVCIYVLCRKYCIAGKMWWGKIGVRKLTCCVTNTYSCTQNNFKQLNDNEKQCWSRYWMTVLIRSKRIQTQCILRNTQIVHSYNSQINKEPKHFLTLVVFSGFCTMYLKTVWHKSKYESAKQWNNYTHTQSDNHNQKYCNSTFNLNAIFF